ncbi:MAG: TonB-dependent siderophore receptor [Cyanobacteria bacterium P01_A01_bin.123]
MAKFGISMRWMVVLSGFSSAIAMMAALPVVAQEMEGVDESEPSIHLSTHLSTPQSATTVEAWLAQIEASLTQITGVRVEETEAGLQVLLEIAGGEVATPMTSVSGDALILEIPNAVLTGEAFEQFEPAAGIALVQVSALPSDRVQVVITGTDAVPEVAVGSDVAGLTLSVVPGVAQAGEADDAIQIVVTGEVDEGYNPRSASTATRTDTPLRDIPQSIQVVPQQVIEDRNATTLIEAVETVSGILSRGSFFGAPAQAFTIRGFEQRGNFRNGFRDVDLFSLSGGTSTVERVEVLRGPASVLFGQVEPGGIVNVITRQPQSEPAYNVELEAGNYGYYQPSVDATGPLTVDESVLYRLIAAYEGNDSFQEFVTTDFITIAPSLTFNIGDRTELNVYYEYLDFSGDPPLSYAQILSNGDLTPRDTFLSYPDLSFADITTQRVGYTLEHELSSNWRIRNALAVTLSDTSENQVLSFSPAINNRFLAIEAYQAEYSRENYFAQIDVLGEFETGSVEHQLLAGFDYNRFNDSFQNEFDPNLPLLDIFDPDYDIPAPIYQPAIRSSETIETYGVYLQDQIALNDEFKLLLGGRYDWVSYENEVDDFGAFGNTVDDPVLTDGAFSPRIGLVYQPNDILSLYASYSTSFRQSTGLNADDSPLEPTEGTQYEVGVRGDFLDGRLSANLAAYHLTKTNVVTSDPGNPTFSIQTGEQRSQGIELDVSGEILPGWNIIASYAYTDAEVTEDNDIPVGSPLKNTPEHQASLWTTYEIQEGDLEGLGFGLGLFYVGERANDLGSDLRLEEYLRVDAAVYYRREQFNAAINIENLFDIDYASAGFGTNVERGEPFTIVGSIGWDF